MDKCAWQFCVGYIVVINLIIGCLCIGKCGVLLANQYHFIMYDDIVVTPFTQNTHSLICC